jgi:hypothetical protein
MGAYPIFGYFNLLKNIDGLFPKASLSGSPPAPMEG